MKILLLVNESPWDGTLANTALRFARASIADGMTVAAVFFQGDGIYNALPGRLTDAGAVDLHQAWVDLGTDHGVRLLLCSAAAARRLPASAVNELAPPFHEAGLGVMLDIAVDCDRVVGF